MVAELKESMINVERAGAHLVRSVAARYRSFATQSRERFRTGNFRERSSAGAAHMILTSLHNGKKYEGPEATDRRSVHHEDQQASLDLAVVQLSEPECVKVESR
jgi:hypothetical protein